MKDRERLKGMLLRHEGLKLKPYKCTAGKLTIGVGRNIEDNGIRASEALAMLQNDIDDCIKELHVNFSFYQDLDEVRQDVLIDMIFNLGIVRLKEFRKTLGYIKSKQYDMAATEMLLSSWAGQVGERAIELSEMMRTGNYTNGRHIQ